MKTLLFTLFALLLLHTCYGLYTEGGPVEMLKGSDFDDVLDSKDVYMIEYLIFVHCTAHACGYFFCGSQSPVTQLWLFSAGSSRHGVDTAKYAVCR